MKKMTSDEHVEKGEEYLETADALLSRTDTAVKAGPFAATASAHFLAAIAKKK